MQAHTHPRSALFAPALALLLVSSITACNDDKSLNEDSGGGVDTACPDPSTAGIWYHDGDADGHGDPDDPLSACEQPVGYVDSSDDCNDAAASARPGAEEKCDEIDNDCDGDIDEDLEIVTWWIDSDRDGFGAPDDTVEACTAPDHGVSNGDDCDDTDAAVYPGAEEVCGDGVYNDCFEPNDVCSLSGQRSLDGAAATLVGDLEDARAGGAVAGVGDVNGDGATDLLIGAPEDSEGGLSAGAAYLVLGTPSGTVLLADAIKLRAESLGHYAGQAVFGPGDLDGDGYDDLVIGEPGAQLGDDGKGGVSMVFGPVSGSMTLDGADARLAGTSANQSAGAAISSAGDVDEDGNQDLWIGDPYAISEPYRIGAVYLAPGPFGGEDALSSSLALFGEDSADAAGSAVSGGSDVDGDGFEDLWVGAPYNGRADTEAGTAYLLLGPVGDARSLADADAMWTGEATTDYAGRALCYTGDMDGDGLPEVAIGGAGSDLSADGAGAVWILTGPATSGGSLADAGGRWLGALANDAAGQELAAAGDVDQDGLADLLIGAPGEDTGGAYAGAAYLVSGPATGSNLLSAATAMFHGVAEGDSAGIAVAGPGDVDGDGRPDLLIGAYGVDTGDDWAGAAYVMSSAGY